MGKNYLWVTRDKDGSLCLFKDKPYKNETTGIWVGEESFIYLNIGINSDKDLFSNVKWEDEEPLAVVLQQAVFKSK